MMGKNTIRWLSVTAKRAAAGKYRACTNLPKHQDIRSNAKAAV